MIFDEAGKRERDSESAARESGRENATVLHVE